MKTKLLHSILLAVALMTALPASAYDFMVDGLCYNRNSDGTSVTVTYERTSSPRYKSLSGAITIPETVTYSGTTYSVTSISGSAFLGCGGLTSVTIPNSVTSIGYQAFRGCSGLTSVTIPNSVTTIGNSAFSGCSGLTSVTIPNSVTFIDYSVFSGCSGLTSVTIPNSVITIGEEAFYKCSGLTSVTIGNSVTTIGNYAFYDCSGLTSVTIPNSVTTIGWEAFSCCSGLTSVTIGNSVTSIGSGAFSGTGIYNNHPDGVFYVDKWVCGYKGDKPFGNLVLQSDSRGIADSAFSGCSGLTSVTIGNSVTSIGYDAFSGCSGLTSLTWNAVNCSGNGGMYTSNIERVTIGNQVQTLPSSFVQNSKITEVTIPNSVTTIGYWAFQNCSGLTSVSIPNSVTTIGGSAFSGCSGLTSLTWNAVNCSGNGGMYTSNIERVTIGNQVQNLPSGFVQNSKITEVTIPNSVTSIGESAFYGCSGLTSVTWNAVNCSSNGSMYTSNIERVTIGNQVQTLPSGFVQNSKITEVTIPNSVTSIGSSAFSECSGLTSVTVAADNAIYDSRKDCNAIIETAKNKLVAGCKATVVPNDVDSVAPYAFHGCTGLTHIHIPNSVASIGEYAFEECVGLQSIRLGTSLNEIGNYAFRDCSNLKAIYNARIRPAAIYFDEVFYGVDRNTCVLYVPRGYSQIYWANADWNRFKIIEEWDPDDDPQDFEPGDVNGDGVVSGADVTALYNVLLDGAEAGGDADVNGDGVVSGADVTALYNLLLN